LPGGAVNALAGLYARARHHQLLAVDLMNSPFYYRSRWTH